MKHATRSLIILISVIIILSGCDVNIFTRFEDIPLYTSSELNEDLPEGTTNEQGQLILDQEDPEDTDPEDPPPFRIIDEEEGESEGADPVAVEVNPAIVSYVERIAEMAESDTLDDFAAEGGDLELLADNLDAVLDAILDELGISLDEDPEDPVDPPETFEEFVREQYGDAIDPGDIDGLRTVVQQSASTAVKVRLEKDPDAKMLVEDTASLLLEIFGAIDSYSRSSERSLDIGTGEGAVTYEYLSSSVQLVLDGHTSGGTVQSYVLVYDETGPSFVVDDTSAAGSVMDLSELTASADLSEIVIPIGETEDSGITLAELLDFADIHLGSNGDTSVRNGSDLASALWESFGEYMPEYAELDIESDVLDSVFEIFSSHLSIDTIDTTIGTFNAMAKPGRTFASTLDIDEAGTVSGVSSQYLTAGGSLNGDGLNMALMSVIGILTDYAFMVDEDDTLGVINLPVLMGFMNAEDAITIEMVDEGTDGEYMRITFAYLADLIPADYTDTTFSNGLQTTFFSDVMTYSSGTEGEAFAEAFAISAGILNDSGEPVRPKKDIKNLEKLIALVGLLDSSQSLFDQIMTAVNEL
ncbi:MAG: hypothetical protein K9M84_09740 [Spirochaetia bacterium]|nr:hypothetical protein [Spirochaetia bacterium]MCF7941883.1 hypothetical protein [Spirochaetia bacterium]